MANYKDLSRAEQKALIQRIVDDCEKLATDHVKNWKPTNSTWPVIEGCAYLRLSTDQQVAVEKGSLEQQVFISINEAESRSNSDKINYKIAHFFIEPGLTGRDDERLQFNLMKREIKKEHFKFVIFKEIARIARDGMIWKEFFDLCIEKECEVFIRGLPINPNDPAQILQLGILAAFAEYESNLISKRVRESNFSAMISSGKFNSTHQVLGLDQLVVHGDPKVGFYVPNKDELATVEWIMRTFVKYASHQKTIEECTKRGIINKNGKPFQKGSLTTLLANRKYIGKWEVNPENKDKKQDKLMPYDRHAEIDLPHGCVVNLELWNLVQRTLKEVAGTKVRNMRTTRVYPLSGILKFEDGSNFQGKSGWGEFSPDRKHYYSNPNVKQIPVAVLEDETKKMVAEIIKSSAKVREAIQRRCDDKQSLSTLMDSQVKQIKNEIKVLEAEKTSCHRRLDFLLDDGNIIDAKLYKDEFKTKMASINARTDECRKNLELLTTKADGLRKDEFDWKQVGEKAVKIQELIQENDPIALKTAYRQLFAAIVVGAMDNEGKRPVRFILREDHSDADSWQKNRPRFPMALAETQNRVTVNMAQVAITAAKY